MNRRRIYLPLSIGFVIVLGVFFISRSITMNALTKTANDTIYYAKRQVASFDDYLLANNTKSEVRLIGKAIEFVDRYHDSSDLSWVDDYLNIQQITGISIVDKDYNVLVQYGEKLPDGILSLNYNIDTVFEYSSKVYTSSYRYDGKAYDVVVMAFEDDKVAIVNFCKDILYSDENLALLFDGFNFNYDGIVAVADGDRIVATSGIGDYSPLVHKYNSMKSLSKSHNFVRVTLNGTAWLGKCDNASNYDYYIFFPSKNINVSIYTGPLLTTLILFVVYYLFNLSRQKDERLALEKERRHIEIINSVCRMYYVAIVVDVKENTWSFLNTDTDENTFDDLKSCKGADEVLNKIIDKYYTGDFVDEYRSFIDFKNVDKLVGDKKLVTRKFKHKSHWFDVSCMPLRNENGEIVNIIYCWFDVTVSKNQEIEYNKRLVSALEQEKRANASKTSFLRRMSHDIRTPINGVIGLVKIAKENEDNKKKLDECLDKITESSGFLLSLVNDVLDMNKLESGEITLESVPFKLDKLVNNAIDIVHVRANERNVKITSDIKIDYDDLVGSPLHLSQVYQNIINNAVKYNREGGSINIELSQRKLDDNRVMVKLVCADTGLGMSVDFQDKVFMPFAQEGNTSRGTYEGTGLGLAITKELTDKMGGSIGFSSVLDKGSTFVVEIPFMIGEPVVEEKEDADYDVSGLNVLVVEDNEINREIAMFMLKKVGVVASCVFNGKEALEKVSENNYDCILMDVMMPIMGGLEATRQIRALGIKVPIIAMSANAFKDDVERSLKAGMNAHLSKPIDEKLLIKTIYKWCK